MINFGHTFKVLLTCKIYLKIDINVVTQLTERCYWIIRLLKGKAIALASNTKKNVKLHVYINIVFDWKNNCSVPNIPYFDLQLFYGI